MELTIIKRNGKKFTVLYDNEDHKLVINRSWHVTKEEGGYCRTCDIKDGRKIYTLLHRLILNCGANDIVDHKNRNALDNRRSNLRIATNSQNSKNKKAVGESKYLGVCKSTGREKWQATIKINGRYKMIGRFDTDIEAAKAYDLYAKQYHKEFANLNFK